MAKKESTAAVVTGKRQLEMRQFKVPEIRADDGVLKVELCGICGSDFHYYIEGHHWPYVPPPQIMGHEVVGRIDRIGAEAARSWQVKEGDFVIVESAIACRRCRYCVTGQSSMCSNKRSYGMSAGMQEPPYLWGGYSQYMYLDPNVMLHVVPPGVDLPAAVLFSSLANGVKWAERLPGLRLGDAIVILGPGQQGLGCVLAASLTGANPIIAVGLERDKKRLAEATHLGATHTLVAGSDTLVDDVKAIVGKDMADVVVDVTGSTQAQRLSLDLVRRGGTVVLAGRTPKQQVSIELDKIAARGIRVIGARAHESEDIRKAIAVIAARNEQIKSLLSHELPLKDADLALRMIGQEVPDCDAVHVALNPWRD